MSSSVRILNKVDPVLRDRVEVLISGDQFFEIKQTLDEDENTILARIPKNMGLTQFIDLSKVMGVEDLPTIPARMQDFAFRYSSEYKPRRFWANEYGVSVGTITSWLSKKEVKAYIELCRYEQRWYTFAKRISLENKIYNRLSEFLTMKITGDNSGAVARMTEFAFRVIQGDSEASLADRAIFNKQALGTYAKNVELESNNVPKIERNVTPSKELLDDVQSRLNRLKSIAEQGDKLDP